MPMVQRKDSDWDKAIKRVLHIGAPNMRKTTALATYPRPMGYICCPNEKGHGTMPVADDIIAFKFQADPNVEETPRQIVTQFEQVVHEFLVGKHGPIRTLAIDGIHKLNQLYVLAEAGGSLDNVDEKMVGRTYGKGNDALFKVLSKVLDSDIEFVAVTVWDAYEKDDPTDQRVGFKAPHSLYPALSGQAAKKIIGEFGMCLYHESDDLDDNTVNIRTAPGGKIKGCGKKLPIEIAKRIPTLIPGAKWKGWPTLNALIFEGKEIKEL